VNYLFYKGIEQVEGDMFKSVPTGDAIILKVSQDSIVPYL